MQSLLQDPIVQAALAPLVVALLLGAGLLRTRLVWFAVPAAFATTVGLSTGIGFTPLTASRKLVLLVLVAPWVGLALDVARKRVRAVVPALAALCGVASIWVFWSVLSQRDLAHAFGPAAGVALFVAAMVALTSRLREDGAAGGGATVALGLAIGVAALLSASIGNFANGIAISAGGGAMLLLQFALGREIAPGYVGMLSVGLATALCAAATFHLAQLPWYAMPLMLLVPWVAQLCISTQRSVRVRLVVATAVPIAAGSATMLAAWFATRTTP